MEKGGQRSHSSHGFWTRFFFVITITIIVTIIRIIIVVRIITIIVIIKIENVFFLRIGLGPKPEIRVKIHGSGLRGD